MSSKQKGQSFKVDDLVGPFVISIGKPRWVFVGEVVLKQFTPQPKRPVFGHVGLVVGIHLQDREPEELTLER